MNARESIEWRWRLRPGPAAWFVASPAALALAFVLDSVPLAGVGCALLGWSFVATAVSLAGRKALRIGIHVREEVRAFEPFDLTAVIENASETWPVPAAWIEVDLVGSAGRLPLARLRRCFVAPRNAHTVRWRTTIARRGSCWVSLRVALCLPGSWVSCEGEGTPDRRSPLWVLPENYVLRRRALEIIASSHFSPGSTLKVAADATEEFLSLREWRPGEGIRRVDWKASSRMGKMVLREYRDPALGAVLVVIDTFVAAGAQVLARWRLERAIALGAALTGQFADAGYRVSVRTAGPAPVDVTLAPRQQGRRDLLRALSSIVPTPHSADVGALLRHSSNHAFGLVVFVALDATAAGSGGTHLRVVRPGELARYLSASHRAVRTPAEEQGAVASSRPREPEPRRTPVSRDGRVRACVTAALLAGLAPLFDFRLLLPGVPVLALAAMGVVLLAATVLGVLPRPCTFSLAWLAASSLVPGSFASLAALIPAFGLVLLAWWREHDLVASDAFGRAARSEEIVTSRADIPYRPAVASSLSRRTA